MSQLATLMFIAWQAFAALNYADADAFIVEPTISTENSTVAIEEFNQELDAFIKSPLLESANVGIKIVSLHTGETLYEHNGNKLYLPASTMKLLTAAVALVELTPNYQFATHLYIEGKEGESITNLYLQGTGDPCFSTQDLEELVNALREAGISNVTGDIIVDESHFDSLRQGKGWMWDDGPFGGYYSEISALSFNDNGVIVEVNPGNSVGQAVNVHKFPDTNYLKIINRAKTIRNANQANLDMYLLKEQENSHATSTLVVSGSMGRSQGTIRQHVDITEPALYAGNVLGELLQSNGITFEGNVYYGKVAAKASKIATHQSPRLAHIVSRMNKDSDNLTAELVLKAIGVSASGTPGSANKGLSKVRDFLKQIGLNPNRYTLVDGSGVSRYNLVSADMLVHVLEYMYENFAVMPEFFTSLAVAGVDGTLSRRMDTTTGMLRAKTGTMRGISTLAGYTVTADKELLAFSILITNYPSSTRAIRSLQDQIALTMREFSRGENT